MVVSELTAAAMIAICGFKNSYRIILKSERSIRRKIRRPAPILPAYDSFPRFFIRRMFRAGLIIAMRWEGRVKNAAQIAADARLRARTTSTAVRTGLDKARVRAKDVRSKAQGRAKEAKGRAVAIRDRVRDSISNRRGGGGGDARSFSTGICVGIVVAMEDVQEDVGVRTRFGGDAHLMHHDVR